MNTRLQTQLEDQKRLEQEKRDWELEEQCIIDAVKEHGAEAFRAIASHMTFDNGNKVYWRHLRPGSEWMHEYGNVGEVVRVEAKREKYHHPLQDEQDVISSYVVMKVKYTDGSWRDTVYKMYLLRYFTPIE
jgi:hypothetical protein